MNYESWMQEPMAKFVRRREPLIFRPKLLSDGDTTEAAVDFARYLISYVLRRNNFQLVQFKAYLSRGKYVNLNREESVDVRRRRPDFLTIQPERAQYLMRLSIY
jgi:hypothetical protein